MKLQRKSPKMNHSSQNCRDRAPTFASDAICLVRRSIAFLHFNPGNAKVLQPVKYFAGISFSHLDRNEDAAAIGMKMLLPSKTLQS